MIELYSADSCIWCRRTRAYLDSKGVDYTCRNAAEPENAERIFSMTGQRGFPVTVIGSAAVVGYDTEAIDKALGDMK
ncbi:MAG: glutaredoxin family protein [Ruminococcus sp.]|nr:glutaredoxin family protein [Ruminococcus sp.]